MAEGVQRNAEAVAGVRFVVLGPQEPEEPVPRASQVAGHGEYGEHGLDAPLREATDLLAQRPRKCEATQHAEYVHATAIR